MDVPVRLLTLKEVADILQLSVRQVDRLLASGSLDSILLDARSRRVTPQSLTKYMASLPGQARKKKRK